jgi:hypothetical protein
VLGGGPGDAVDREPGRGRDGGGRYPGEGHGAAVEVGLVGVAGFCRHEGGAVTGGEVASLGLTGGVLDQQRPVARIRSPHVSAGRRPALGEAEGSSD